MRSLKQRPTSVVGQVIFGPLVLQLAGCSHFRENHTDDENQQMSAQTPPNHQNTQKENTDLGRQCGRSDAGYTLLLEKMTLDQWDAFLAGEIDADALREQVLRDPQTDLGEWSE